MRPFEFKLQGFISSEVVKFITKEQTLMLENLSESLKLFRQITPNFVLSCHLHTQYSAMLGCSEIDNKKRNK